MTTHTRPALLTASALLAIPLALASCAGRATPEPDSGPVRPAAPVADTESAKGVWVPSARASFATIDDSALFTLAHSTTSDLIVIENYTTDPDRRRHMARHTWILEIPSSASLGTPVDLEAEGSRAFLMEEVPGETTNLTDVRGSMFFQQRGADEVVAVVNLASVAGAPGPGETSVAGAELSRRFVLPRRAPYTPQPMQPGLDDVPTPEERKGGFLDRKDR